MINTCIVCDKQFEAEKSTKKTCSDICRQKLHREKATVTKIVPTVTKNLIVTGADLTVTDEAIEVTPEIERKLATIYKEFEKKYNNRFRGSSGNIKIPDIKCVPCFKDGKRVLSEWEKAVLKGGLVYEKGEVKVIKYEEVKKDSHKELVFTNETQKERIAAYLEEYKDYTYVPNWILNGFNSKKEALNAAMKAVQKSVGVSNSAL